MVADWYARVAEITATAAGVGNSSNDHDTIDNKSSTNSTQQALLLDAWRRAAHEGSAAVDVLHPSDSDRRRIKRDRVHSSAVMRLQAATYFANSAAAMEASVANSSTIPGAAGALWAAAGDNMLYAAERRREYVGRLPWSVQYSVTTAKELAAKAALQD